jgi:hypothetical protein
MSLPPRLRAAGPTGSRRRIGLLGAGSLTALVAGCAPRARPLAGAPVPVTAQLPVLSLPAARTRVVFRWRYEEEGFSARGEGAARLAPPDSARLDFFLDGGFGAGWAILVGDSLTTPPNDPARRLVPPTPMLWATLGRLAVPEVRDTTLRASGDTLRADLRAGERTWRTTVVGGQLVGLEQLAGGRVLERLTRDGTRVRYAHLVARRSLSIDVTRTEPASSFPPTIWSR